MFLSRGKNASCQAAHLVRYGCSLLARGMESSLGLAGGGGPLSHRNYAKLVSFPLAQTGEGISECELIAWAIKEGDLVSPFDKLCDVQSDKASIEITSRYGGRVVALHHTVGAMVKVGAPLVDMEVPDEAQVAPEHLAAAAPPPPPSPTAAAETQPAAANTTAAFPAAAGAAGAPAPAAVAATVSAAPGAAPVPGAAPGVLGAGGVGLSLSVGPLAALLQQPPAAPAAGKEPAGATPAGEAGLGEVAAAVAADAATPSGGGGGVHATPAVRALARELGVDLATVAGSGPGGRVTKADVLRTRDERRPGSGSGPNHLAAGGAAAAVGSAHGHGGHRPPPPPQRSLTEAMAEYQRLTATAGGAAAAGAAAQAGGGVAAGGAEVVPLRGYRRAMVRSMTAAASVPLFHLHDEIDVGRFMQLRAELRHEPALKEKGVRLTLLPFLLKALSAALREHPQINASLAPAGDSLTLHPHHNIGVAMATPTGLVVPNIKQVERKSVADLALELGLLQQLAGAGRLPAEALAGGTISVSNIGAIGGCHATPLVAPPELAIVALGRTDLRPRYPRPVHQQLLHHSHPQPHGGHHDLWTAGGGDASATPMPVPVPVLPVSWGADHRAVDGAALASFHNTWRALVEAPERLLLHTA